MAATPGKVVFKNDLMELIQYAPQTDQVRAVPVLASPPWINKYYVMDLAPGRSFLEWAVQHERTVFAISYRNPDVSMRGTTLDDYLTAAENLRFHAELYGVPTAVVEQRVRQVFEMVGLWERRDSIVRTFSGGMKRRLEIARGLLHSPRVLFLDEPTVGLDPQTRSHIWSYINELKRRERITMFLTTHYMDEAEYCDRIAIMDNGVIVVTGTPEELKAGVGKDRIQLHTDDDELARKRLKELFGIEAADIEGGLTLQVPDGERFIPRLFASLGVGIRSVSVARPTLDDVFMEHTGRTIRDAEVSAGVRNNPFMRARGGR
jgi:ABC-2 type transport system ATP-binding protein